MARISETAKFDILARNNIVDVITQYVPLKKSGKNYQACCPFHQEKTPSFSVSEEKQFYHCFGCGAHGDAIDFLRNFNQLSFTEALEDLAQRVGYTLTPLTHSAEAAEDPLQPLFELMKFANEFYQRQLRQKPLADHALAYLKKRGLSKEILKTYGVGFSPPGWDNLLKAALEAGYSETALIKTGLAIKNDKGRVYDRFRNRVMFPILDTRGNTVGFGGRVLDDSEPKYLNSPETPLFHKGQDVYGWHQANTFRKAFKDTIFITEGYMDVLALAEFGFHPAVATLGTATTEAHLKRLFRYRMGLVFCFDGDAAGRKAAERALDNVLPLMDESHTIRFMFLPEKTDPDSFLRTQGPEAFETAVKQARPWADFLFENLQAQMDITTVTGRTEFTRAALKQIDKIPPGMTHSMLLEDLAARVHLDATHLRQFSDAAPAHTAHAHTPHHSQKKMRTPMQLALALLLREPRLSLRFPDPEAFARLPLPGAGVLAGLVQRSKADPSITGEALVDAWEHTQERTRLRALLHQADHVPLSGLQIEWQDTLTKLIKIAKQTKINQLLALAKHEPLDEAQAAELNRLIRSQHTPESK